MFSIWGYNIYKNKNKNNKHLGINYLFLSTFSTVPSGWLDSKEKQHIRP